MPVNLYSPKVKGRRQYPVNNWIAGLSDYNKMGGSYLWARGVDYRTEPSQLTILPQGMIEAGSSIFTDLVKWSEQVVGRTIILGSSTNLISNGAFETDTTGWTLGADYTRSSSDGYLGSNSIKQLSAGGSVTLTTASGSGLATTAYADYQLVFYNKVTITSGQAPTIQVLGGSLTGPNLLSTPEPLNDTAGVWSPITLTFNAGQYTSVFIVITNQSGTVTAYYDFFTLVQINSLATYAHGNTGQFYKRYSNSAWVTIGSVSNSHGNGMAYYGEDDFIYLASDITVGRYGPISSGTPSLVADYLTASGGVPTNTNSALLVSASSQYFVKATPSAALSGIASSIALEVFIKPTSLPAVGSSMTLMGIWNENTNKRAWKFDLLGVSGLFGTGTDGALTISSNTTEAPIDSQTSGTISTNVLNANNVSFAAGQKILIIQMQGTGYGTTQITTINGYDNTNHLITTADALNFSYNSSGNNRAQVRVLKQYTNVTVNSGITYKPKDWNGTVGGVLAFLANGTISIVGNVSGNGTNSSSTTGNNTSIAGATGGGFRGGIGYIYSTGGTTGGAGEGTSGPSVSQAAANGSGGGGGTANSGGSSGGGGGGNGTVGSIGAGNDAVNGAPGAVASNSDLTRLVMGAGGGGMSFYSSSSGTVASGASGGAIIYLIGTNISVTGTISSNGGNGGLGSDLGGAGSGAAGSILLKSQNAILGTGLITATGGTPQTNAGGAGGNGVIVLNYLVNYTGTTSPTINPIQDNTLLTTPTYQVRLGVSNDGTAFEYLTQTLQHLAVGAWDRLQVSWLGSSSTASFYEGGVSIGTSKGTKTAIYASSNADFAIGANVGAAVYQNFLDAEVNDARVWNTTVTKANFAANNLVNLNGVAAGLVGGWFVTNTPNDLTASANNLTPTNSPTYVTDVPYPGATTRGDLDQTGGTTANNYTLGTALVESVKKTFVPTQDPQKSIQVNINAKGTGDWTMTVHDGLNQQVATLTVTNANLAASGLYEFIFSHVWRPVVGATYHFHLYSTVADGSIKTTTAADITTAYYNTYFQFLVSDTDYHPLMQIGNVLGIGNERYLAVINAAGGDGIGTYNGQGFNSRRLRFPAGWRVRSLAKWRGYYAIGCWKGTNIKDFDQGIVFLWDGYAVTYNDFFEVPEGAVNAMYGENGILYIIAGYHGDLLEYTGGDRAIKVKRIPKVGKTNYMEVAPGAITMYDSLLRIGVSYNSDSTTLERGVYTWGHKYETDPKSLSYDYPISTGSRGTSVSIGALMPVGGSLLSFYQDSVSFGVNNINPSNAPQTSGTIEEIITDFDIVWKDKQIIMVRADHLALPTGANVDVKYKLGYESTWHSKGLTEQVVGDVRTRFELQVPEAEYHVLQIGLDLYAASGNTPTILEHSHLTDLEVGQSEENGA